MGVLGQAIYVPLALSALVANFAVGRELDLRRVGVNVLFAASEAALVASFVCAGARPRTLQQPTAGSCRSSCRLLPILYFSFLSFSLCFLCFCCERPMLAYAGGAGAAKKAL